VLPRLNLRKAGIQNTRKEERLKFDQLDPFAGTWLHATGDYTERGTSDSSSSRRKEAPSSSPESQSLVTSAATNEGKIRRAAVCIGPEHGTVRPGLGEGTPVIRPRNNPESRATANT
jgi:adenine-specific DNA-methyltransferase